MASQVVEITDRDSGSSAQILVSLGFNCFSWRPVLEDGPREMFWAEAGFETGDKRPSSGGDAAVVSVSWADWRSGIYVSKGASIDFEPGDAFGNAIHGFVYNRPWRVVEQSAARVVGEFQASVDDRVDSRTLAGRFSHSCVVRSSRWRAGERDSL